jgi:hypothetical protein
MRADHRRLRRSALPWDRWRPRRLVRRNRRNAGNCLPPPAGRLGLRPRILREGAGETPAVPGEARPAVQGNGALPSPKGGRELPADRGPPQAALPERIGGSPNAIAVSEMSIGASPMSIGVSLCGSDSRLSALPPLRFPSASRRWALPRGNARWIRKGRMRISVTGICFGKAPMAVEPMRTVREATGAVPKALRTVRVLVEMPPDVSRAAARPSTARWPSPYPFTRRIP